MLHWFPNCQIYCNYHFLLFILYPLKLIISLVRFKIMVEQTSRVKIRRNKKNYMIISASIEKILGKKIQRSSAYSWQLSLSSICWKLLLLLDFSTFLQKLPLYNWLHNFEISFYLNCQHFWSHSNLPQWVIKVFWDNIHENDNFVTLIIYSVILLETTLQQRSLGHY